MRARAALAKREGEAVGMRAELAGAAEDAEKELGAMVRAERQQDTIMPLAMTLYDLTCCWYGHL
jgi:hypothetical protein